MAIFDASDEPPRYSERDEFASSRRIASTTQSIYADSKPYIVTIYRPRHVRYSTRTSTLTLGMKHDTQHFAIMLPPATDYKTLRSLLITRITHVTGIGREKCAFGVGIIVDGKSIEIIDEMSCKAAMALAREKRDAELACLVLEAPKGYDGIHGAKNLRTARAWETMCSVQ